MVTDDAESGNKLRNNHDRWAEFTFVIVSPYLNVQTPIIHALVCCVVNLFVELGKKPLGIPGVKAVFNKRFNQDPLEFFWKQCQRGGYHNNSTVKDFIYGTQSLE